MKLYAAKKRILAYFYEVIMSGKGKKYIYHFMCDGLFFASVFLFSSGFHVLAQDIRVPMDLSIWKYSGTKVKCSLTHLDTSYGKFYFRALPNYQLSFEFQRNNKSQQWRSATLSEVTPPWVQPELIVPLDTVKISRSGRFSFRKNIKQLLRDIDQGKWIQVFLTGKKTSSSETVTIPLVRVHQALKKFQSCRSRLPVVSFHQARTVVLHYVNGQRHLSSKQVQQLKDLMTWVDVDSRIRNILIDGYTDNTGSSVSNLSLSRTRAEEVARVLTHEGAKSELIQIRAHGSRYPVASNHTQKGRAANRRVTIRLVRDNETVVSRERIVPREPIVPHESIVPRTTNQTKKVQ